MALMTCLDCKTEMSDAAKACPKCGWVPFSKAEKTTEDAPPFILVGMILGGVGAALYFTGAGGFGGWICGVLAMLAGGALTLWGFFSNPKRSP